MASYDEVVARNIRGYRNRIDLGQERLAARMRALGYKAWLRQTVSKTEKGERRLTAAEIHGLAWALQVSVAELLEPTPGDKTVDFPSGSYVGAQTVAASVRGVNDGTIEWNGDTPVWIGVSYPPGQHPEVEAWRQAHGAAPLLTGTAQPVVAAIVTSSAGILITKRRDGKPPWGFVTGEIEPFDAGPAEAAIREVKEETGLLVLSGAIIGSRVHPAYGNRTMIYMACAPTNGLEVEVGDEAELEEVRWASLAEADELLPGMYEPVRAYLERELR